MRSIPPRTPEVLGVCRLLRFGLCVKRSGESHVVLVMPCNQTDLPTLTRTMEGSTVVTWDIKGSFGGPLVVSNAPEKIPSNPTGMTLYKGSIPIDAPGPTRIRVFFWHYGEGSTPIRVGLRAHVSGGTALIDGLKGIRRAEALNGDLSFPGICLAKAQLFGTLDDWTSSFQVDQKSKVIWTDTIPALDLLGSLFEFNVTPSASTSLNLRFFATVDRDEGDWSDTPVAPGNHVRGWWPHWGVNFENEPPIVMTLQGGTSKKIADICWAAQAEATYGKLTGSGHEYDKTNKGLYGVDQHYKINLFNSNLMFPPLLGCELQARDTLRGKFWGAAHALTAQDELLGLGGVPIIRYRNTDESTVGTVAQVWPIGSLQFDLLETLFFNLRLANGGAADLPISLVLRGTLH